MTGATAAFFVYIKMSILKKIFEGNFKMPKQINLFWQIWLGQNCKNLQQKLMLNHTHIVSTDLVFSLP